MHRLPIAVSQKAFAYIHELPGWTLVPLESLGGRDAAAFVVCLGEERRWGRLAGDAPLVLAEAHTLDLAGAVLRAASAYEHRLLPRFTGTLAAHAESGPLYFATPGHHGGRFFDETAGGRLFRTIMGEGLFRLDLSDSDDVIGDTSSHEGPGGAAEALAAEVYHADRTYFVLNGTSGSNRICCAALLAPGDLVLVDRNSHKSIYQGALDQCGATPVFLEGVRNEAGVIGGLPEEAFREPYLRKLAGRAMPGKEKEKRPFRLACLQLATYDGIFVNARRVLEEIGPLCDYILFDAAWVGYESFIPFLADESPLTLPLTKKSPGLLVTQSVHKQLAGFSQTSQIHRKDAHLSGKKRRVADDVFQNAFLHHVSTSPSFPLFAGLEMNAAIHREKGKELWAEAVRFAVELRKDVLRACRYVRPFQPEDVDGRPWASYATETIASERRFWEIRPGEKWHGFRRVGRDQCLLDPCKVLLTTGPIPGPAAARYLQERGIVPEKSDFSTVLFLAEPGDGPEKRERLVAALAHMEEDYDRGALLGEVLPGLSADGGADPDETFRALCKAQRRFFRERKAGALLSRLFSRLPREAMGAREASEAFVRGERELVPLAEAEGRTALVAAAAYPPGICVPAAGETWERPALDWCRCLLDFSARFPAFAPELHGVSVKEKDGRREGFVWVYKK